MTPMVFIDDTHGFCRYKPNQGQNKTENSVHDEHKFVGVTLSGPDVRCKAYAE